MVTVDEIREFVDETIDNVLQAPHVYAAKASEIDAMLLGLDAVRRFIRQEKAPIRGYARRRKELGISPNTSLQDHVEAQLKKHDDGDPSDREVMKAVCKFWKKEIFDM